MSSEELSASRLYKAGNVYLNLQHRVGALSPARWHDKHTNLYGLRMLGTTQLNFFFYADHLTFNNGVSGVCPCLLTTALTQPAFTMTQTTFRKCFNKGER